MQSREIRKKFFDYFIRHGHEKVSSSSLIPAQDPTLLFANAGMNQFKDLFLGNEQRGYKRAVSIQKCVRAGGKHNDLDNVGFTKRHLTFFEMMGNFSFGDYFKKEAISFAWEFITKDLEIAAHHLHVSVFQDDQESYDLWLNHIGVPAQQIHKLGAQDNFWQMGDTGPCGPCTEIYYDRGPAIGCQKANCAPGCSCDRFLEFWNLVFMQFDRQPDGSDKKLQKTGVDTGMGLERLCAIMQHKDSVFLTDLFMPIIMRIQELSGKVYEQQPDNLKAAFHVLADHIRSSSLLIADGCAPSNDGRGYVLRKIIRRAALFAQKLSSHALFPELTETVVEELGAIYPELITQKLLIYKTLQSEITKFSANLIRGKAILQEYFDAAGNHTIISGAQAFKLYDTFGFPKELIVLIAQEHGFSVDLETFDKEMLKQREQSGKKETAATTVDLPATIITEFTGYQELTTASEIIALIQDNHMVTEVAEGSSCWVITQKSPFFIVGGGQVPDQGWLEFTHHKTPLLHVQFIGKAIGVNIVAPCALHVGMPVTSIVNQELRVNAMKNHTATHMLQAALIELFGKHIKQSGSLVHPDYLRFDFTYHESLSPQDINRIENLVNEKIREDIPVHIEYMPMKTALARGALAFFGDKYNPEQVRMVDISNFSVELCGGTHVPRTGAIGTFKITEVSTPAAGHRRIVAVTGPKAVQLFQECFNTVKHLGQEFKVQHHEVSEAVQTMVQQLRNAQQNVKQLKHTLMRLEIPMLLTTTEQINGIPIVFASLEASNPELQSLATELQNKQAGFYFLYSTQNNKVSFIASLHPTLTTRISLPILALWLKTTHTLKGGVSGTHITGGGTAIDHNVLATLRTWIEKNS
jgi:alanyl-tRNA synthetase